MRAVSAGEAASSGEAGSQTWKVVPLPGWVFTWMKPPWLLTMPWTVERPRPVPWPMILVVKNGSKIRSTISGGMPLPVSLTSSRMCGPGLASGSMLT